jgi:hypothetical protein
MSQAKTSQVHAVLLPWPIESTIWSPNCTPLVFSMKFPPGFTLEDKERVLDGLKAVYEEVLERSEVAEAGAEA